MNIYVLTGLPGSGKSTWAKKKSEETGALIVNRDSIRQMFYGSYNFDEEYEYIVKYCTIEVVKQIIDCDVKDLIIDECNLTKLKREFWINVINSHVTNKEDREEIKIVLVYFSENNNNLEYRCGDLRGLSKEYWNGVIKNMKIIYEPPSTNEEFDDLITITISKKRSLT
jgi:tRNA uridine 5-carbamoylmethylation protein Kti12